MKCLQFFPFQIRFVLTDNGKEFVVQGKRNRFGKITKKNLFEAICSIAGIEHRKTKVKHPWTNGLAERMVRTTKENTTKVTHYQNKQKIINLILVKPIFKSSDLKLPRNTSNRLLKELDSLNIVKSMKAKNVRGRVYIFKELVKILSY